MPSSTNSWQEQNGSAIFCVPLTLPHESFLPSSLPDWSRLLPCGNNKPCNITRLFPNHRLCQFWVKIGNSLSRVSAGGQRYFCLSQTVTVTRPTHEHRQTMQVHLPPAAVSWSTAILWQEKPKGKLGHCTFCSVSWKMKAKRGSFCLSTCLYVLRGGEIISLSFPSVFTQRLFVFPVLQNIEENKCTLTTQKCQQEKSHKNLYKYMHIPKTRCTYQSTVYSFLKLGV